MKQNSIEFVGGAYNTRNSGDLVITKYVNKNEVYVEFVKTGYTTVARMGNIRKGTVKDRLLPSVYKVRSCGDEIVYVNGKHTVEYELWAGVLQRTLLQGLGQLRSGPRPLRPVRTKIPRSSLTGGFPYVRRASLHPLYGTKRLEIRTPPSGTRRRRRRNRPDLCRDNAGPGRA